MDELKQGERLEITTTAGKEIAGVYKGIVEIGYQPFLKIDVNVVIQYLIRLNDISCVERHKD